MRVSQSTDDLASFVPRNVMLMIRVASSLRTSGSRPDARPTSRTIRGYGAIRPRCAQARRPYKGKIAIHFSTVRRDHGETHVRYCCGSMARATCELLIDSPRWKHSSVAEGLPPGRAFHLGHRSQRERRRTNNWRAGEWKHRFAISRASSNLTCFCRMLSPRDQARRSARARR